MRDGAIKMDTGPLLRDLSILAWDPKTKEITSGPAKGQLADNENEAIAKHQEALEASKHQEALEASKKGV